MEEGFAYHELGKYEDSVTALKRYLGRNPGIFYAHLGLAADYIALGQNDAARAEAEEVLKLNPQFTLAMVAPTVGPKGKVLAEQERWAADLRKAGLN
jgi:adenylate cyclase